MITGIKSPELISIKKIYIEEAYKYSFKSRKFTSNRHDFHEGGLNAKQRKMYEGKLGEKIFKQFLIDKSIGFTEDSSHHTEADKYDFIINEYLLVDVKTRTKDYHTRTLEMVEQFNKNPKHIYISVRLYAKEKNGFIIGWFSKNDIKKINRVENNGYLDNYVFYDNELRDINTLIYCISERKIKNKTLKKKENKMKIKRMTCGDWGKVKALFTITTEDGISIDGFKIVEKFDGDIFVGFPSKQNKDGDWNNTIFIEEKEKKAELENMAVNHYEHAKDL